MANSTFNAAVDYFGLVAASNPKLKIKSSAENRTKQSASGANSYGDVVVVDSYGETAAPSAEYEVIDALTAATFPALGTCATPTGLSKPVVLGSVTITTATGAAPTVSASGTEVQTGATTLRTYSLPTMSLTTRHRAQDFLSACDIKKGSAAADADTDYGLTSVTATFPIEVTLSQPQGEVVGYDLHGGTATVQYEMQWYASTAPTIALTSAASTAGWTISAPLTKSDAENGYTTYSWTVSLPLTGTEYTNSAT